MSTTSNRVDLEAPVIHSRPPLQEGNRVLESIGRRESLRALLAFSDLHEQIRNRPPVIGADADWDLIQTERFVLSEVLQLICDRAQTLTKADGLAVALVEGSDMVCRATAGPLPIQVGSRLSFKSQFLRDCLESGKVLRCDDSATDTRLELDFSHRIGARATVLVPLCGRRERLGVLQAFSTAPWSFTDQDVRCFDLFAELVLAALKPEDQDRRFHWLSGLAGNVLQTKLSVSAQPVAPETASKVGETAPEDLKVEVGVDEIEASSTGPAASEDALFSSLLSPDKNDTNDGDRSLATGLGGAFTAHPGLSVVLGLVAVATLFSAGVWWGMQVHGKPPVTKLDNKASQTTVADRRPSETSTAGGTASAVPPALTAPSTPTASDDLLDTTPSASQQSALIPVEPNKLAALPKITGVRHWSSSIGSTIVIDMDDQVPYEVHRLMSPERIYFDLHDTALAHDLEGKTMDVGDVSLTRVRVAQPVAGVTRIVLDTKDGSNFSVSMESDPYRLVVELRDNTKAAAASRPTTAAPAAILPAAPTELALNNAPRPLPPQPLPPKSAKFRIVLDAGHGGWDLGTVGRQGLLEKDLVLDVTRRLGKLLRDRLKSDVLFTRLGDEYLPLDQRADFANEAQADLFVSVHANYSSSATARGVETYYTNLFSAPGFKEIEKHDDRLSAQPVQVSMSATGLHDKIEESRHLAASVQRSLYATLAAKSPDIRDRGIKDSAFAVLTGTTMPAILTEISFVSSPADERNLRSDEYRQQIAEALYKGIARYQSSSPRAKVAQLQPGAARR